MAGHTDLTRPPDRRRTILIGALIAVAVVAAVVLLRSPTTPSETPAAAPTQQSVAVLPDAVLPDQPDSKDRTPTPSSTAQVTTEHTSASFLGLRWHKTSVTVTAGGSVATASAFGLDTPDGTASSRSGTTTCFDITSSGASNGTRWGDPTMTVAVDDAVATVQVVWPDRSPAQTIKVTLTACPASRSADDTDGEQRPRPGHQRGRPILSPNASPSEQRAAQQAHHEQHDIE